MLLFWQKMTTPPDITPNLLMQLIHVWEHEIVEFKGKQPGGHDVSEYVSAIANEAFLNHHLFGWYIIGVDNKTHRIVGTGYKSGEGEMQNLLRDIQVKTGSEAEVHVKTLFPEGKRVLIFRITAARPGHPVYAAGHAYGRIGDSIGALEQQRLDRIRFTFEHYDWSAHPVASASIEDLDPRALAKAREVYLSGRAHLSEDARTWSDIDFLERLQLIRGGFITNACLLLLGKRESMHKTGIADAEIRWILRNQREETLDYKHLYTPLLLAADSVYGMIRNTTYRYMTHQGIIPAELQRYDEYTLREAINNAIAHADYTLHESIDVVEYENDRVIIRNAGQFLPETLETVLTSTAPFSRYRNGCLVSAMVDLRLIDKVGSGIRTMFNKQIQRLFPVPEYEISPQHVQVTLQGKIHDYTFAFNLLHHDIEAIDIALLYDVYKGRRIERAAADRLREKGLISGRFPKIAVAAFLGETAPDPEIRETIFRQQEMSTETYIAHIKDILRDKHPRSRADILHALKPFLPLDYEPRSMERKVSNLLKKMLGEGLVSVEGTTRSAKWKMR